jgi:hypothetical protein
LKIRAKLEKYRINFELLKNAMLNPSASKYLSKKSMTVVVGVGNPAPKTENSEVSGQMMTFSSAG